MIGKVDLTVSERAVAALVGQLRNEGAGAMRDSIYGSRPVNKPPSDVHILGALGELAFAKFFGVYWDCSVGTFKSRADVAGWEVRTRAEPHLDLIVRPTDGDERRFALVVRASEACFHIVGGIVAKEAKRAEWWHDYRPKAAWFVPQHALKRIKPPSKVEVSPLPYLGTPLTERQ